MNAIDATDRHKLALEGPPPSLLTLIVDTNPQAWASLSSTLPLDKAVASIQVFVNAHLAISSSNRVAILASHCTGAQWLYPQPATSLTGSNRIETSNNAHKVDREDANKYRSFSLVEERVVTNLRQLLENTTDQDLDGSTSSSIASALSFALAYIAQATRLSLPMSRTDPENQVIDTNDGRIGHKRTALQSRILIISVSGDLADQYIPVMNGIFAAQRQRIPIDILKLAGDSVFLQQACDATKGIYVEPEAPQGILQYLMMALLPDQAARQHLVLPSIGSIDFRAACFCHRDIVDIGYVCSICLSIFCRPLVDSECLTCGTRLTLQNYGAKPVVVSRKKKKKKRATDLGTIGTPSTPRAGGTPAPG